MPSDTQNVKLGICNVYFDSADLGYTKGGVEVEVQTNTHEIMVDQFGETLIGEIVMGRTLKVTIPLAETTIENLVRTMPGTALSQTGGVKATGTVTFAVSPPINNDTVTIAGVVFTFKTVPVLATDLAIPGTIAAAATALAAAVNANLFAGADAIASAAAGVVTLTGRDFGAGSNAVTMTKVGVNITVSGATLAGGVNSTKKQAIVSTGVSISLLNIAKKMVLRPKGTNGEDDFTIFLAATAGALQFAYKVDNERVYNTTFRGYAKPDGTLFSIGDVTA
ncbi:MAG: hypothetical protein ACEQSB_00315 [Undibacterium sp.]